jgi:hypothetical protein
MTVDARRPVRLDRSRPMSTLDPANPADPAPTEVDDNLSEIGRTGAFEPVVGGFIECCTCGTTSPASLQSADEVTRLEGVSDPSDMQIVVPVTCPNCGTSGALVMGYGPEATTADIDVLSAMPRTPREATRTSEFDEATPGMH